MIGVYSVGRESMCFDIMTRPGPATRCARLELELEYKQSYATRRDSMTIDSEIRDNSAEEAHAEIRWLVANR